MITIAAYLEHCYSDTMNHRIKQLWGNAPSHLHRLAGHVAMQKYLPVVLTWMMIAAFCWLLAYWTWMFATPRPSPALDAPYAAPVRLAIDPLVNAHLFGVAEHKSSAVSDAQLLSALGLKLRGVFAGSGKQGGAAIINIGQKDKAFTIGDEVAPRVTLAHVYADYVELKHGDLLERLDLERTTRTEGLIVPVAARAATSVGVPLAIPDSGYPAETRVFDKRQR